MQGVVSTPVRTRGERTAEGWIALQDVQSTYLDGAEAWLYEMMQDVEDLSSTSTEMVLKARDWAERYHTDPSRSNVIRPFTISPTARVLEIGAGCGAVTRYLGERAALVDAIEPVQERARVARARTRDLPNVEVFMGLTEDVPEEPTYDVIVIVGVLEYVGNGSAALEPYEEFLRGAYNRLLPDGTLILAIENKLGVKYFSGAPEDHTGRMFDSLESYPMGGIARTFSRRELESLVESVGFDAESKVAFPDYKLTRTVIDADKATAIAPAMAHKIPQFPSHDWYEQRPKIVDEGLLWKSCIDAGIAADTGNSLIVIGRKSEAARLWPADLIAAYYSVGRNQEHLTETRVTVKGDGAQTERRLLRSPTGGYSDLTFIGGIEHVSSAQDFGEALAEADDDHIAPLLGTWLELVACNAGDAVLIDLIPQNLLIESDGTLVVIDQEWTTASGTWDEVRHRGLLRASMTLATATAPARWPGLATVRDVVRHVAALVGVEADQEWFGNALAVEARILEEVACPPYAGTVESVHDWWIEQINSQLDRALTDLPLGVRVSELLATTTLELAATQQELASYKEQVSSLTSRAEELDAWTQGAVAREQAQITQIQARDVTIGSLSSELSTLQETTGASDAAIETLTHELGEARDALSRSADVIMSTAAELAHATARVDDLENSDTALRSENRRLADHVAHLEDVVNQYDANIASLLSSATWRTGHRLSAPLVRLRTAVSHLSRRREAKS